MLNFDEMIKCGQKYDQAKKQMLIEKYEAFIDYLKKVVNITFKDNEKQIASYLKETTNQSLFLNWCVKGVHYDGFNINRLNDETIRINLFKAHDCYYDPILNLESDINNDELLSFFDKEYKYLLELFIPCYLLTDLHNVNNPGINKTKSLVWKIANTFNIACYDNFKIYFELLGMKNKDDFTKSKFSLSFTDERRNELDKEVFYLYNSYSKKVLELTKKFDDAVKDLK